MSSTNNLKFLDVLISMPSKFKAYLALLIVCVVWGGTFLAVSLSVESLPPLFLSGFRQVISGGLLTILCFTLYREKVSRREWKPIFISGACIVFLSNTLVVWSLKTLPTGLVALLMTSIPIWVTLLHVVSSFKLPNIITVLGLAAGLGGIVLIFRDSAMAIWDFRYWVSIVILLAGTFFWALGSVLISKNTFQSSPFLVAGIQLLIFGIVLLLVSFFLENWRSIHFPLSAWTSLFYLIVLDQMIAYAAYIYALRILPVTVVSIFVYVNPVVAIFLGWLVRNEAITWHMIMAGIIIFIGVYLLNKKPA